MSEIPTEKVNTYRRVQKLSTEGATAGERRAAASRLRQLEKRYPGIAKAHEKATHERIREAARESFHVPPPPVQTPTDGLLEKLLKRGKRHAVEWATETLAEAIEQGAREAGVDPELFSFTDTKPKRKKPMASKSSQLRERLNDDDTGAVFDEYQLVQYDPVEGSDSAFVALSFTLEIPETLWADAQGDPETFVRWLNDQIEEAGADNADEEPEEEPD